MFSTDLNNRNIFDKIIYIGTSNERKKIKIKIKIIYVIIIKRRIIIPV